MASFNRSREVSGRFVTHALLCTLAVRIDATTSAYQVWPGENAGHSSTGRPLVSECKLRLAPIPPSVLFN
jgi:hypothetical protein